MNRRILSLGLVAVAAAVAVVLTVTLWPTGNNAQGASGAQLSPSSAPAQGSGSTPSARADAGTLLVTRISPTDGSSDIYLVRSDGTGLKRLTAGPGDEQHASWSPDGTRIVYSASEAFSSPPSSRSSIWVMNADGSGKHRLGAGVNPSWSPDGKKILYSNLPDFNLSLMNADGRGRPAVILQRFGPSFATWAPNGKIVFVRGIVYLDQDGGDLWAANPDGSGLKRLTKGARLTLPSVSPDGSTIAAFTQNTHRLVTVPYSAGGRAVTLLAHAPRYFTPRYPPNPTTGRRGYRQGAVPLASWAPDGKKLVLGGSELGWSNGTGLFLVNRDGSGLTRIPGVTQVIEPDWRP
jgi:Tol biopolymer transport system component